MLIGFGTGVAVAKGVAVAPCGVRVASGVLTGVFSIDWVKGSVSAVGACTLGVALAIGVAQEVNRMTKAKVRKKIIFMGLSLLPIKFQFFRWFIQGSTIDNDTR